LTFSTFEAILSRPSHPATQYSSEEATILERMIVDANCHVERVLVTIVNALSRCFPWLKLSGTVIQT
jgi:hypothetical protein